MNTTFLTTFYLNNVINLLVHILSNTEFDLLAGFYYDSVSSNDIWDSMLSRSNGSCASVWIKFNASRQDESKEKLQSLNRKSFIQIIFLNETSIRYISLTTYIKDPDTITLVEFDSDKDVIIDKNRKNISLSARKNRVLSFLSGRYLNSEVIFYDKNDNFELYCGSHLRNKRFHPILSNQKNLTHPHQLKQFCKTKELPMEDRIFFEVSTAIIPPRVAEIRGQIVGNDIFTFNLLLNQLKVSYKFSVISNGRHKTIVLGQSKQIYNELKNYATKTTSGFPLAKPLLL